MVRYVTWKKIQDPSMSVNNLLLTSAHAALTALSLSSSSSPPQFSKASLHLTFLSSFAFLFVQVIPDLDDSSISHGEDEDNEEDEDDDGTHMNRKKVRLSKLSLQ